MKCWNCGKKSHIKCECNAPKKAKKKEEKESTSINLAIDDDLNDALVLYVDNLIESWVLDSSASLHSTSCKELIRNFMGEEYGKVYLIDGKPLDITSKDDVHIKSGNSCKWILRGVQYISRLS